MDIATYQRTLLGLIKGTYAVSDAEDPHIREVAQSANLKVVQDIVLLWQVYVLERGCPLTSALLKRRDLFIALLRPLSQRISATAYRERQMLLFLEEVSRQEDSLLRSIAQFEYALLLVKLGDTQPYRIGWDYDPYAVLSALLTDQPLPEQPLTQPCKILVSHRLPNGFEIA
jgi:hypothetical protein